MKALIYIRVSTLEQAKDGYSIGTQKKRLMAYAQSQDWDILNVYVDDGYSAKDLNRPDMQRMINDIKENKSDELVVLVFKLDRMTRSVLDLYKLLDIFEKHNTKFKSATEVYDTTTAIGRLFITLVAALAQWERENLSERVKVNMEEMVMGGNWHGGIDPFGYKWDGKELKPVPERIPVVKEIYRLYANGLSDYKIAKYLNAKGIVSTKGYPFAHTTVQYILQNPIYAGDFRYNMTSDGDYFTVENVVEPIIDRKQFELVQKIREGRKRVHPRQATSNYIFSGKLICNRCGSRMLGNKHVNKDTGVTNLHYYCRKQRIGVCDMPYLNESHIEKQFLGHLSTLMDEIALEEVAASIDNKPSDKTNELKQLKKDLKSIKERKKKWQLAFASDAISLEDLRVRSKEDDEQEKEILARLEQITNEENSHLHLDQDQVIEIIKDIQSSWENAERVQKKSMIQILINEIIIDTPDAIQTRHKRNEMRPIDFINISFN